MEERYGEGGGGAEVEGKGMRKAGREHKDFNATIVLLNLEIIFMLRKCRIAKTIQIRKSFIKSTTHCEFNLIL